MTAVFLQFPFLLAFVFMAFNFRPLALPLPNRRDLIALPLVIGMLLIIGHASRQMAVPFHLGERISLSLDPGN
ncbi:MAG: hypothetical protein AB7S67_12525, partial [Thiomonas sp.]